MFKLLREKKIFYRLILLSLITTPLFAILGGTPFFRFEFKNLNTFLEGIIFTAVITLLFWIINISLLLLAEKFTILKSIFLRAGISIVLAITFSAIGFSTFMPPRQPLQLRLSGEENRQRIIASQPLNIVGDAYKLENGDSAFTVLKPAQFKAKSPKPFFFPMILRSLTINLIILTLCELVFLYFRKQEIENENIELKQMNLEAKNSQLKMQLHPHFLFNSLNTLRLLLKKDTDKAEDYLLKLSDILRFSTTSALNNVVEIEDELNLCMAYLQMQKVRFGDMLNFSVTNSALYNAKGKLPVYSLQLLAENAIKHNSFTEEEPLIIYIDYDEMQKEITVRNKVQLKRTMEPTTKTGLKNLDKRYRLLNHTGIYVSNSLGEFRVSIDIL